MHKSETVSAFTLSVEFVDAPPYRFAGVISNEDHARSAAEDVFFHGASFLPSSVIRTVAIMVDGFVVDCFDGSGWVNATPDWEDYSPDMPGCRVLGSNSPSNRLDESEDVVDAATRLIAVLKNLKGIDLSLIACQLAIEAEKNRAEDGIASLVEPFAAMMHLADVVKCEGYRFGAR